MYTATVSNTMAIGATFAGDIPSSSPTASPVSDIPLQPAPYSVFISTFVPVLVVAIYLVLAIYGVYAAIVRPLGESGGIKELFYRWTWQCLCLMRRDRRKKGGYANVTVEVDEEELEAGPEQNSYHSDGAEDTAMESLPVHVDVSELQPEYQHQSQSGSRRGIRPRRKRPAPLSLLATRPEVRTSNLETHEGSVPSPSCLLNVAKFFDHHTGRLNADIIQYPVTGLESLCEPAPRPVSLNRRCAALQRSSVRQWAEWVVDRGVEWVQRWLEDERGGSCAGGGEYQLIQAKDDDTRHTIDDGEGIELDSMEL